MSPRLLLDTHIAVRWLAEPDKLSREQTRALRECVRRREPLAISAFTLMEIAVLFGQGGMRGRHAADELINKLCSDPAFEIVQLTKDMALEIAAPGPHLRDPVDRSIVATARVQRLQLVTSDQRNIESNLVRVIE